MPRRRGRPPEKAEGERGWSRGCGSPVLPSRRGRCGGVPRSGRRRKMADEAVDCSFVFKKRGLAAGRGRRKRPSSDQERGERGGGREEPREAKQGPVPPQSAGVRGVKGSSEARGQL